MNHNMIVLTTPDERQTTLTAAKGGHLSFDGAAVLPAFCLQAPADRPVAQPRGRPEVRPHDESRCQMQVRGLVRRVGPKIYARMDDAQSQSASDREVAEVT